MSTSTTAAYMTDVQKLLQRTITLRSSEYVPNGSKDAAGTERTASWHISCASRHVQDPNSSFWPAIAQGIMGGNPLAALTASGYACKLLYIPVTPDAREDMFRNTMANMKERDVAQAFLDTLHQSEVKTEHKSEPEPEPEPAPESKRKPESESQPTTTTFKSKLWAAFEYSGQIKSVAAAHARVGEYATVMVSKGGKVLQMHHANKVMYQCAGDKTYYIAGVIVPREYVPNLWDALVQWQRRHQHVKSKLLRTQMSWLPYVHPEWRCEVMDVDVDAKFRSDTSTEAEGEASALSKPIHVTTHALYLRLGRDMLCTMGLAASTHVHVSITAPRLYSLELGRDFVVHAIPASLRRMRCVNPSVAGIMGLHAAAQAAGAKLTDVSLVFKNPHNSNSCAAFQQAMARFLDAHASTLHTLNVPGCALAHTTAPAFPKLRQLVLYASEQHPVTPFPVNLAPHLPVLRQVYVRRISRRLRRMSPPSSLCLGWSWSRSRAHSKATPQHRPLKVLILTAQYLQELCHVSSALPRANTLVVSSSHVYNALSDTEWRAMLRRFRVGHALSLRCWNSNGFAHVHREGTTRHLIPWALRNNVQLAASNDSRVHALAHPWVLHKWKDVGGAHAAWMEALVTHAAYAQQYMAGRRSS